MNIIYRKAELNDIPKLNPLLAQLSDAMADPQKMAEKIEKIAKNEDNYLLVAENTENGDLCGSLIGVVFEDICDTCKPIYSLKMLLRTKSTAEKVSDAACLKPLRRGAERKSATTAFWSPACSVPARINSMMPLATVK